MHALIIGGGVIGLSIGWQLARLQWKVEIFERGVVGKEASWAAAGMLAPYSELGFEDEEHLRLGCKSLALYPQFLSELNRDAGSTLAFEKCGTLFVGIDRDDRHFLERLFSDKIKKGLAATWLSGKEAREKEPLLSPRITTAVWIDSETHIHNRNLLSALKLAFENRGGLLHEHCGVKGIWEQNGSLKGIKTNENVAGNLVINTAGAWADEIRKEPHLVIRPNKGQILTLAMPQNLKLSYMIRTPRVYLVPKSDHSLRIGATSEDVGFDQTVTGGAILELLQAAFEAVPSIEHMEFREAEAKLRPASFDRLPSIEETNLKGYFRAVGHGRAGILLTPYTTYEVINKIT